MGIIFVDERRNSNAVEKLYMYRDYYQNMVSEKTLEFNEFSRVFEMIGMFQNLNFTFLTTKIKTFLFL